jgi:hypothetical protein
LDRWRASSGVRPHATVCAADSTSGARLSVSRPSSAQACATRSYISRVSSTDANGTLNSSAYRAASCGVRRGPLPPMMTGGPGTCTGLGSPGESTTS